MKTLLLIPVIVLLALHSTRAQNDSVAVNKIYRIWIIPTEKARERSWSNPTGKGRVTQGVLFEVKDSSIRISNSRNKEDYSAGHFKVSELDARKIKGIKIRRNGALGTAVLIGGISGALVGIIAGIMQHTDGGNRWDQELQHGGLVIIPLLFTGLGTGISGAIGGATINIPIKGSQSQFDQNRSRLNSYSIKYNSVNNTSFSYSFKKLRDTVVDFDGNVYHTAALGGMVIMVEDLMVTHFHNGKEIPYMKDSTGLSAVIIPAYCNYRSDSGFTPGNGRLYNWHAVSDTSRICPKNWHIPSYGEWTSLINCLGGTNKAAGKLMENFSVAGKVCKWWSSTGQDNGHAQSLYLDLKAMEAKLTVTTGNSGLPVRCIRDY
jgi:hypothetical protein